MLSAPSARDTTPPCGHPSAEGNFVLRWGGDGHNCSAPVIAKEYDQRLKRWRTTVAIQDNMSAGGTPAVLFYLLDRHASLAMTMGD